jgi:NAD+ synthase (glutamine-hydrolysing)
MNFIRVAAASPPVKVADVEFNIDASITAMRQAHDAGASVLVLPELGLTGYSCGDLFFQPTLLHAAKMGLLRLARISKSIDITVAVGLPFPLFGRLYNCAALLSNGKVCGIVPKQYIPNSGEYYEQRWFTAGSGRKNVNVDLNGNLLFFGNNQIFCDARSGLVIAVEICEDLWAVTPPSNQLCLGGANLILNLSASNEVLGKAEYRRALVQQQSARAVCAYAYAGAGPGESSSDVVFSGHCLIAENGVLLAESARFQVQGTFHVADIDLEKLEYERRKNSSFSSTSETDFQRVQVHIRKVDNQEGLFRPNPKYPFVPSDFSMRKTVCHEVFSIQTTGLIKRLVHMGYPKVIVGVSGGLDSALALLVIVAAFDRLSLSRTGIVAVNMPGFGTTIRTEKNASALINVLGVELVRIDITKSVTQHLNDIQHQPGLYDLTYENAQSRERTQILMDLANQRGGLVVGTGDLSEVALGWSTFNGDHMSMYQINAGVPKTLVKYLVEWCADTEYIGAPREVLTDIIATPISPELLPLNSLGEQSQTTEETLGPYELHDFFLYHLVRLGSRPTKIFFLAQQAFGDEYSSQEILTFLRVFYKRFFSQQYKRSSMPDGPKVGSVALSPRGDWRMPSDAEVTVWFEELNSIQKL